MRTTLHSLFTFTAASVFLLASSSALAETTKECGKHRSHVLGWSVPYCVQKVVPESSRGIDPASIPTVFYMHGLFDDHQGWFKGWSDEFVRAAEENNRAYAAITFDTSPVSFFTDFRGHEKGPFAFETWFVTEFMPEVTHRHQLCDHRDCRSLVGESMGGFGALKTALRYPDLFSAVATSSAALPAMDPYGSWIEWMKYFAGKPIKAPKGGALLAYAKILFKNRENFARINPIALVERFDSGSHSFPRLYIQCGGKDLYGFEDGFFLLKQALDRRGFEYESRFYPEEGHFVAGSARTLLTFLMSEAR